MPNDEWWALAFFTSLFFRKKFFSSPLLNLSWLLEVIPSNSVRTVHTDQKTFNSSHCLLKILPELLIILSCHY